MSENCANEGLPHVWGMWGSVGDYRLTMEGGPYFYRRGCQRIGCAAFEEAAGLVPTGKHLVKEGYHVVMDRQTLKTETVWTGELVTDK